MSENESKVVSASGGDTNPKTAEVPRPTIRGVDEAPIIFFEAPTGIRSFDGMITIGLAASKIVPMSNGSAETVAMCVAYLKGTTPSLIALRKAIDDALLLGAKTDGQAN